MPSYLLAAADVLPAGGQVQQCCQSVEIVFAHRCLVILSKYSVLHAAASLGGMG